MVEDDASARELIERELRAADANVVPAASLQEAASALEAGDLDCVVLDLSLPDGWGLDTLLHVRRRAGEVPVVVVSGTQGAQFEAKALRSGAAGYVLKGSMTPGSVTGAVVDAIERARSGAVQSDPISELAAVGRERTPITAGLFGQRDLEDAIPGRFDDLVAQYSDLLELALERTAFADESHVSDHLRELAYSLGAVRAGPRDVVRLHARALDIQSELRQGAGAPDFMHEARLVVLELMGYLVSYYRLQTLGRDPASEESD